MDRDDLPALGEQRLVDRDEIADGRLRGGHGLVGHEERQVLGARDRVVHQRAGKELAALGVVDRFFAQCLPGALRHPAVDLPLDDHVVDDAADVVAARDAYDVDFAGVATDLHLAGLGTVRP